MAVRCRGISWERLIAVALAVIVAAFSVSAETDTERKRREIKEKIEKLQKQKETEQQKAIAEQNKNKPQGENLQDVIVQYEKLLAGCAEKKSTRCPDVLATLASLYYDEARDSYIEARNQYEEKIKAWEKKPVGPEPQNPLPEYSKSLNMYNRLIAEYPDFGKIDEAYYQIGNIYTVMGEPDKSREAFDRLVQKMPNSPRASYARVRLADDAFTMNHDHVTSLKHLEAVKTDQISLEMQEMVMYRKGEIYYNMGDFDKAIEMFFGYIENCDNGTYRKCQYRDESLQMMAVSYSDMPNGPEEAGKFFRKIGGRPYENYIVYTIGMKNFEHGQYDAAIISLQAAVKRFPNYGDAAVADQMVIGCYLVKKQYDKANESREKLVDTYSAGSSWYVKNSSDRAAIEKSQIEVRRALSAIPLYFHAMADKSKDRGMYEKALKRYNEYFQKFPEDKWRVYEFKFNVAWIYNTLGDYDKAAANFDYVAMEELAKYPELKIELDTMGLDQDEIEKEKRQQLSAAKSISQEDAGYNAIAALDNLRKKAIAKKNVNDEQSLTLPETQRFLEYISRFQKRFPQSANAAEVVYLAGGVYFSAKDYQSAIREYQSIVTNQPNGKLTDKALRMLANSYANNGDFDLAQTKYRELLAKTKPATQEYQEISDLAAGAMFKKAENIEKSGNTSSAVEAYKQIGTVFPESKVADRGWFQAGVVLEKAGNNAEAAAHLEVLPDKFPKSSVREDAFFRSAENYKKVDKYDRAADVLQKGAMTVTKPQFAISALAAAADCYAKVNKFDMAGKMYQLIFERYANDPKTPSALYAAGMNYEKAKMFEEAIKVYLVLAEKFPQSEYSSEAFFSVGLCYEKMGQNERMAAAFTDFAKKYPTDRLKQVQALVKAGDAYFNLKSFKEATDNYVMAMDVAREWGKKSDIDPADVAHASYMLGDIKYQAFLDIKLEGATEREVKAKIQEKTKALEEAAKPYAKAIELGVEEWTMKATYKIGMGFVDMAEAWSTQKLFGSKDQQVAARINICLGLEPFYTKALAYFQRNIEWSYEQNIQGEYVTKSIDKIMEMAYRIAHNFEDVGTIFKNAPLPPGMTPEDKQAYQELLEEKALDAQDKSVPKYEAGVKLAADLGIANSQWLDKIRERITEINPNSPALQVKIAEHVYTAQEPEAKGETAADGKKGDVSQARASGQGSASRLRRDDDYERSKQRIRNIMNMEITAEDKIKQLSRIEMDAQRKIVMEEGRIKELKEQVERQ